MARITFELDFGSGRGLDGIITKLERLNTQATKLESVAKAYKTNMSSMSGQLANSLKSASAQVDTLGQKLSKATDPKNIGALAASLLKYQDTIKRLEKDANEFIKVTDNQAQALGRLDSTLKELNTRRTQLISTQAKLSAAGKQDTQAYKNLTSAIGLNIEATKRLSEQKRVLTFAYAQEIKSTQAVKNSYNALTAETNILVKKLKEMPDAFNKNNVAANALKNKIAENTEKLKQFDAETNRHHRSVANYSGGILQASKNLGMLLLRITGVVGAFEVLRRATSSGFNVLVDYDEGLAGIQKTTGLAREEAIKLTDSLQKLNTRTSLSDLMGLATAGGRLGLQDSELLEFVEATDKAFVALGDTLEGNAEEIGNTLGKISAVFGDEAEFGVGAAITKIGSALNELGANSKATEGNIIDFTQRVAGVASQADISSEDIMALGALFDEAGQSMEVAGTTLNILLPEIGKNVEHFAALAGQSVPEFTKLLEEDAFEALKMVAVGAQSSEKGIVGLTETLENFGVDSARAAGIVGVLAGNIDRLNELQGISNKAFKDGTSLQDEFNVKNATLGATVDRLSEAWGNWIIGLNESNGAIGTLKTAIEFVTQNFGLLMRIVGTGIKTWLFYKGTVLAVNTATRLAAFTTNLFTGKLGLATKAMTAFNAASKANIIGVLVAGVYSLVQAFGLLNDETKEGTQDIKELTEAEREYQDLANKRKQDQKEGATLAARFAGTEKQSLEQLLQLQTELTKRLEQQRIEAANLEVGYLKLPATIDARSTAEEKLGALNYQRLQDIKEENLLLESQLPFLNDLIKRREKEALSQGSQIRNAFKLKQLIDEQTKIVDGQLSTIAQVEAAVIKRNELQKELNDLLGKETKEKKEQAKLEEEQYLRDLARAQAEQDNLLKEEDALREINAFRAETDSEKSLAIEAERQAEIDKVSQFKDSQNQIDLINLKYNKKQDELRLEREAKEKKAQEDILEGIQKEKEARLDATKAYASAAFDAFDAISEKNSERLEREATQVEKNIQTQERLAEQGLENTLAFETQRAAEIEKRRVQEQRKRERAAKIETFFNLMAEFAKGGDPQQAAGKAIAQMALAEAVAATFRDGGIVEDKVGSGIIKGASHERGGVLIEAEGNEGILSTKHMKNLGKDNFYALQEYLDRPVNGNLFGEQADRVIALTPKTDQAITWKQFKELKREMAGVRQAIENKPVPYTRLDGLGNIIETEVTKGLKKHTIKRITGC